LNSLIAQGPGLLRRKYMASNMVGNGLSDPSSSDSVHVMPKSCQYTDASVKMTEEECVCILNAGAKFLYILPGFDVLQVELLNSLTARLH